MKIYIYDHDNDKTYNIPIPNFIIFNKTLIKFVIKKALKQKNYNTNAIEILNKLNNSDALDDAFNSLYALKKKYGEFLLVEIEDVDGDIVKITI